MKKNRFVFILSALLSICCCVFLSSCSTQDTENSILENEQVNLINTELIYPLKTRSETSTNNISIGYLCTSDASSLRLEVYPNENNMETYSYMVDEEGNSLYFLKFEIESFISDGVCMFTASNEFSEPVISGIYDTVNNQIKITDVYINGLATKASAAAWGCGLAIGIVGGIWSTAAGTASLGAGFIVGLSYTAMAIAMCDGL